MTTPERLRRRQIRNDWFIATLAVVLCLSVVYFRIQDAAQRECFAQYAENQSIAGQIRSGLVERESQATRAVISAAGAATTRSEFDAALSAYESELRAIDKEREENPLPTFDPERC